MALYARIDVMSNSSTVRSLVYDKIWIVANVTVQSCTAKIKQISANQIYPLHMVFVPNANARTYTNGFDILHKIVSPQKVSPVRMKGKKICVTQLKISQRIVLTNFRTRQFSIVGILNLTGDCKHIIQTLTLTSASYAIPECYHFRSLIFRSFSLIAVFISSILLLKSLSSWCEIIILLCYNSISTGLYIIWWFNADINSRRSGIGRFFSLSLHISLSAADFRLFLSFCCFHFSNRNSKSQRKKSERAILYSW